MQKMRTPEEVCNRIAMLHESLADVHRQQCPTGEAWQATIASLERLGLQHELVGRVKALLWALGEEWDALEAEINGTRH